MNSENPDRLSRQADQLYERYGKPLEADHWGEYVVITPSGETVLGATLVEAATRAAATLGRGNFAFRVGERAVAIWR